MENPLDIYWSIHYNGTMIERELLYYFATNQVFLVGPADKIMIVAEMGEPDLVEKA